MDYCLVKIVFIAAIGSSTTVEVFCWACWFACVGFVKLFSGLARDRFDSLLSTPVATAFDYGRSVPVKSNESNPHFPTSLRPPSSEPETRKNSERR